MKGNALFSCVARNFFVGGRRLGHLKGITRPRQRVWGGGGSPRMVEKFKFLKRSKVLEKESICLKCQHFSAQKSFFLRRISKNWTYFTKVSLLFLIEKFLSKMTKIEKDYWKWDENSYNFGENRVQFVEKFKIINIWWIVSIGKRKVGDLPQNLARWYQKWSKSWKVSRNFWDFYGILILS